MALNRRQQEILDALAKEAEQRAEINSSLDNYVKALDKARKIQEEIDNLTETIADETAKLSGLTGSAHAKQQQLVNDLIAINNQLKLQQHNLKKTINSAKVGNMLIAKGGASIVKTFASIPKVIEGAYSKIKGYGLFDMDKAMKKTALSIGLAGKQSRNLRFDIKSASENTTMFGSGIEELAQYQAEYSEELGRSVMLGQGGLQAIAEMAKGTLLGAEGAAKMAAEFELQGVSAERTRDLIEETVNKSAKMGINSSKVIKNMQSNMKLLNKYNFKGGIKGLQKMAEITSKFGIEMTSITGMADKLFDIEGAVDMAAQLQVLGGAWANLGDPFKLMYMARNDMAGLTEEIAKAAASTATFNSKTGEFDISAMEMHRLRKISEATGVAYEDLASAAKNAAKFTKIKSQIAFTANDETKEFLENTSKLDEKGKAYIEIRGEKKYLNQLSQIQIKQMMDNKQSLKERADSARTFDETLTNFQNLLKQQLLPLIEGLEPLAKNIGEFVTTAQKNGWFNIFKEISGRIGDFVAGIGKFALEWPKLTLGLLAMPTILSGFFGLAKWYTYGVSLGHGFLSTTAGSALLNKMGGKGLMTGGAMVNSGRVGAGMYTAGKAGLNFGGKASGALAGLAGLGTAIMEYNEQKEKGKSSLEAGGRGALKGTGAALGGWGGAKAGAALGGSIGSLFGGAGAVPGALIGGLIGGVGGGMLGSKALDLDTWGVKDGLFEGNRDRAVIQGGKITPIDNKDDLLAMKKHGVVDKVINKDNTSNNTIKHDFGVLKIDGKIEVTTPGNTSTAVDLMRDPNFVRELQIKITEDLIKKNNQLLKKG
jgi:hypothetical protein